jgi:hypothetical protein
MFLQRGVTDISFGREDDELRARLPRGDVFIRAEGRRQRGGGLEAWCRGSLSLRLNHWADHRGPKLFPSMRFRADTGRKIMFDDDDHESGVL